PSVQQPLDQKPVGSLERNQRHPQTHQPGAQRPDPRLVVVVALALQDPPTLVDHAHCVLLASPVDPSKPPVTHHPHSLHPTWLTLVGARYPGGCLLMALHGRDLLLPLNGHLDGTSGRRWSRQRPSDRASPKRRSSRHPPTRKA